METLNLDKYIFQSFDRIKDIEIDSINFIIESHNKLDVDFLKSLFENFNIKLEEKVIGQFFLKRKYKYYFQIKIGSVIDKQEYALLVGKVFILCAKLYAEIKTFGMNI